MLRINCFISKLIFGDLKWFWLINHCMQKNIYKRNWLYFYSSYYPKNYLQQIYIFLEIIQIWFECFVQIFFYQQNITIFKINHPQVGCVSNSFSGLEIKKEECNQERETNCHEMKFESKARSFFSRLLSAPFFWNSVSWRSTNLRDI